MASNPATPPPGEAEAAATPNAEHAGPIVNMVSEPENSINEMFAIALRQPGMQSPLQVPLRMRKLPHSFWNPPASGSKSPSCHSRENSIDNTLAGSAPFSPGGQSVSSPQPSANQLPTPGTPTPASPQPTPQPFHSRAHSSPATLQQTLAVAPQQQQQHVHLRQPSYDVSTPGDNLGPLPPGWEMAQTPQGQVYFMNHITKSTCWDDPRKQMQTQMVSQPQPPTQLNGNMSPQHQRSNSAGSGTVLDNLGPLPQGWEQGVTNEGEIYFINHVLKKTTWVDPRLEAQRTPAAANVNNGAAAGTQAAGAAPPNGPFRQQPPQAGAASTQVAAGPVLVVNGMTADQRRQQEVRLQRLENERRALAQRRVELTKQLERRQSQSQENMLNQTEQMMMRQTLGDNSSSPSASLSTDMDPFMSSNAQQQQQQQQQQAQAQGEAHNRQESADSGVGMGSNFNLGSIPEDLPIDMEMETTPSSSVPTPTAAPVPAAAAAIAQQSNAANSGSAGSSNTPTAMDSTDALIPTLPPGELGEVLSQDIMQDVLGNRGLTWL